VWLVASGVPELLAPSAPRELLVRVLLALPERTVVSARLEYQVSPEASEQQASRG
jgi:hypothetical protein